MLSAAISANRLFHNRQQPGEQGENQRLLIGKVVRAPPASASAAKRCGGHPGRQSSLLIPVTVQTDGIFFTMLGFHIHGPNHTDQTV
jgi:hypothetical protein